MFDFGFSEILLTSGIALVVIGPQRLPGVIKKVGGFVGQARRVTRELNEQLFREVHAAESLLKESKGLQLSAQCQSKMGRGLRAGDPVRIADITKP